MIYTRANYKCSFTYKYICKKKNKVEIATVVGNTLLCAKRRECVIKDFNN